MSERITAEQVQSDVESYALRASPDGRRRVIREALDKARREGGEDAQAEVARLREALAASEARAENPLGKHTCPACGKQSRVTTAGCDHCDYEDK